MQGIQVYQSGMEERETALELPLAVTKEPHITDFLCSFMISLLFLFAGC
jgi:hypothetical protein